MGTHPIFESDFDCLTEQQTMAWQGYVDNLKAHYPDGIAACGVFGQNGSTCAQSGMDHASANYTEITAVFNLFTDPSSGYSNGFHLNGEKYALLRTDDSTLYGKGKSGDEQPVTIMKTTTLLIIAIGVGGSQAGSLNKAVGKVGDYLVESGY